MGEAERYPSEDGTSQPHSEGREPGFTWDASHSCCAHHWLSPSGIISSVTTAEGLFSGESLSLSDYLKAALVFSAVIAFQAGGCMHGSVTVP